jgi:hypothetical protein
MEPFDLRTYDSALSVLLEGFDPPQRVHARDFLLRFLVELYGNGGRPAPDWLRALLPRPWETPRDAEPGEFGRYRAGGL